MPDSVNLDNWYNTETVDSATRAGRAWGLIQRNPTSIVLIRDNVAKAAQTVRIEYGSRRNTDAGSQVGMGGQQNCIIFGVRGHGTVADTDIKRADRFKDGSGNLYEVKIVINVAGGVQAQAEMLGK